VPSCGILGVRGCPLGKTPGRSPGKGNGCLELAGRVRQAGRLPAKMDPTDRPQFVLRGPNIGMQKTVAEAALAGSILAQPLPPPQPLGWPLSALGPLLRAQMGARSRGTMN